MSYPSVPEHSTYTYLDQYWPFQIEFDNSGKPVKILIKEQFAPFAEKAYTSIKKGSDLSCLMSWLTNIPDKMQLPKIPEVTVEFGGVTVFIFRVLLFVVAWAAKRGIEMSRFRLITGGMTGSGIRIGRTPMGGVIYQEC